jgi:hypothetical protein
VKGIAATILRLLYVSRMQRWLAGIGFTAFLVSLGTLTRGWQEAEHFLIALAGVLGSFIVVIAPIVAGPILFSSMAAPRNMALIPHGRLKLLLGAMCSQLLLAAFIGAGLGAMKFAPAPAVFAIAFGALTFFFLGFCLAFQYRLVFLFWLPFLVLPRILSAAFPQLHLASRIATPRGLIVVVAASLLAWVVYGIRFVKSRRARRPVWSTVGLGSIAARLSRPSAFVLRAPRTFTPRGAAQILLTGNANFRRVILLAVLVFGAFFIFLTLITAAAPQPGGNPAYLFAFVICFMAALIPGIISGVMARRARLLWLSSGKGRAELFTALELQCWRFMFLAIGAALLMAVPIVALGNHSAPAPNIVVAMAAVPLSCGSALVYTGLLYIRGNRFADLLIITANAILLALVALSAVVDSHAFPALIGSQIILVPVLRWVAQGRWNRIDWLLLRQPLAAARLA